MKVESIRSRMPFKDYDPRVQERLPEGLKLVAGLALTAWAPSLMYGYAIGQAWPFYLTVFNQVLGALIGLLIYKQMAYRILSCVPVNRIPNMPGALALCVPESRKAA